MKLGEMSAHQLVSSALDDFAGLDRKLVEMGIVKPGVGNNEGDNLVVAAYLGSIGARLAVAEDLLK